ncbi:type II secretory pathway predicted ATPase ExeA [Povalibacter uvarum]|uniref:Type II secretory pathway predicted ATPase ExeA n=1 Tax=Povalibacter uvarum TaxID=732238 RepID=A0A841HEZ3_9GAMM|nr:AAA family ATPase [Povalibacter uvarum]MBB6091253.1 type II secretory pathway predicted ATPase ExeA [Povalibacter uvarum]
MYESYYGLREKPFALVPDPAFLYPSRHHQFAAMMLEYAVMNRTGFALLTGEVGSGKTMLLRRLLSRLGPEVCVGMIANTNASFGKLLQWVCLAFDLPYQKKDDAELYQTFVDFLVERYAAGQRVLLIVDEAQNLDPQMLEELRVLSNVNADRHLVLQTILVGQPELRETLRRTDLRQFAQRIGIDYHLPALTLQEARMYVRHRLKVAGGAPDLIETEAIDLAWSRGCGIPRLVNQLCETALIHGFADQRSRIDLTLMEQVVEERSAGGIFPGAATALPLPVPA